MAELGAFRPILAEKSHWIALGATSTPVLLADIADGLGLSKWQGRHWILRVFGGGTAQVRAGYKPEGGADIAVTAETDGVPIQTGEVVPVWVAPTEGANLQLAVIGTDGSFLVVTPASL